MHVLLLPAFQLLVFRQWSAQVLGRRRTASSVIEVSKRQGERAVRNRFTYVVAGAAIALASCSFSASAGKTLNTGKAETEIAKGIKQQTGVTVTMKCPSDVKIKAGTTITCKAKRADGPPLNVAVTMQDGKGNITWKVVE
jgi:hypothetical protein